MFRWRSNVEDGTAKIYLFGECNLYNTSYSKRTRMDTVYYNISSSLLLGTLEVDGVFFDLFYYESEKK